MAKKYHINVQRRIDKSTKIYGNLALRLRDRFIEKVKSGHPEDMATWLINMKRSGTISKSTWRLYRASLKPILRGRALKMLEDEPPDGARPRGERKRTKSVNDHHFERLKQALSERCQQNGVVAERLTTWIHAGITTGLRPMEWEHANLNGSVLLVRNAKHSHGRAHGDFREIQLCTEEAVKVVGRHLDLAQEYMQAKHGRTFRSYYTACRGALARVNRTLPKSVPRIALYSARHQFKINAKKDGVNRDDLAYLMGHAVTGTAQRHYGRPGAKGGSFAVRAYGKPDNPIRQTHRVSSGVAKSNSNTNSSSATVKQSRKKPKM